MLTLCSWCIVECTDDYYDYDLYIFHTYCGVHGQDDVLYIWNIIYTTKHIILYDFNLCIDIGLRQCLRCFYLILKTILKFFCWRNEQKSDNSYGILDMFQCIYMHQEYINILSCIVQLFAVYSTCIVCGYVLWFSTPGSLNVQDSAGVTQLCVLDCSDMIAFFLSHSLLFSLLFVSDVSGDVFSSDCSQLHNWNADWHIKALFQPF